MTYILYEVLNEQILENKPNHTKFQELKPLLLVNLSESIIAAICTASHQTSNTNGITNAHRMSTHMRLQGCP